MFRLLLFTYVLGGLTFVPLLLAGWVYLWFVSSSPVGDADPEKIKKEALSEASAGLTEKPPPSVDVPNQKPIQGWVTARRTFEEPPSESSYAVSMMRNFLDSRSGDPKRLRPKDTYYAVLKSNVLYLYEDDSQNECFAAIGLASYEVLISPDVVLDAELFAKRNGIMLREIPPTPSPVSEKKGFPSLSKDMKISGSDDGEKSSTEGATSEETAAAAAEKKALRRKERAAIRRNSTFNLAKPWFLFVKSNTQMEDWYLALLHASTQPMATPPLLPLLPVFSTNDMAQFVSSIDNQSDPIPMRWLNALIGRLFFSLYKTSHLEKYIIGRIVRKISKIQLPGFLSDVTAKEVSVGTTAPMFNKPMLKELTKEGDASVEVGLSYKGEVRITIEAKANINIGIKNYTVDLVVAVVLREIEGNLLIKIKRPPSNRIWYAFTHQPKIELEVEPVVADRSIKWSLILNPITTKIKEAVSSFIPPLWLELNTMV